MVGKAVKDSLDPPRREADSHTEQRMVFMCPAEEELEDPFPGGSHCWAGGGEGSGVVGRGEVNSLEPLLSHTMAPVDVTMTLEVIDFWNQDISHLKKKKSMFHVQQCLVKKRKIAAACSLMAEKSEPHQLQQGKQQCPVAVLYLLLQNY